MNHDVPPPPFKLQCEAPAPQKVDVLFLKAMKENSWNSQIPAAFLSSSVAQDHGVAFMINTFLHLWDSYRKRKQPRWLIISLVFCYQKSHWQHMDAVITGTKQVPNWSRVKVSKPYIYKLWPKVCISPQESPRNHVPHFYPENTIKLLVIRPSVLPCRKPWHLALGFFITACVIRLLATLHCCWSSS